MKPSPRIALALAAALLSHHHVQVAPKAHQPDLPPPVPKPRSPPNRQARRAAATLARRKR